MQDGHRGGGAELGREGPEVEGIRGLIGVDGGNIPLRALAACYDRIFARITVDVADVVPGRRNIPQEVEAVCGCILEVVGRKREVLDGILEKHCRGKLELIRRAAYRPAGVGLVQELVEETSSELHASDSIADERVERGVLGLDVAFTLAEYEVLGGSDGLAADVVGVHALPATGQGAAVEDHHQAVVVGVAQHAFVHAHGLLLVTAEEIDLDALDPDILKPLHLLLALNRAIHLVERTLGDIIPVAAGRVPEEYIHSLGIGVFHEFLHPVVSDVLVPEIVHEDILEVHGGGEVDELDLVVIVDAAVLPEYPAPGSLSELVIVLRHIPRLHDVPCDGAFGYRLQGAADGDSAPRGSSGDRECGLDSAVAVILLGHGELDLVTALRIPVAQAAAAVAAVHARFADERPAVAADLEETGEGVAVAVLRFLVERLVDGIEFFIAGLGALPAYHGVALWGKESRRPLREYESGALL